MAKGYLINEKLRCIRFKIPGRGGNIRCAISFDTLADSFGAMQSSDMEDVFILQREAIEAIAQKLVSAGRPVSADAWVWIRTTDC
jgi:hypothetical protein